MSFRPFVMVARGATIHAFLWCIQVADGRATPDHDGSTVRSLQS
jgi:hypothetical protein